MTLDTDLVPHAQPHQTQPPPPCAVCRQRMRLVSVEPHLKFGRLDIHCYVCKCGHRSEEVMMRAG